MQKDYGVVSMFEIVVVFLISFVGLNINDSIARIYFDEKKYEFKKFLGNCIYLVILNTIIYKMPWNIFKLNV